MFNGVLKKMITEYDEKVNYFLDMGNDFILFKNLFQGILLLSLMDIVV